MTVRGWKHYFQIQNSIVKVNPDYARPLLNPPDVYQVGKPTNLVLMLIEWSYFNKRDFLPKFSFAKLSQSSSSSQPATNQGINIAIIGWFKWNQLKKF